MTRIALCITLAWLAGCASQTPAPGGRPSIRTISPGKIQPGYWFWVEGSGLRGQKVEVIFTGGAHARNITTDRSGTKIHVEVPQGAQSGKLVVRIDGVDSTPGWITILPPRGRSPY